MQNNTADSKPVKTNKTKTTPGQWVVRLFLIFVTVITLYPVVWNILSSLKTNKEFISSPFSLPQGMALDNFSRAWTQANIGNNFFNSLVAVLVLIAVMITCVIPCSYALSRYRFFGSKFILNLFMAAIFVKATYITIPLFLQMDSINMTNKIVPYAILYAVTQFPFSIFLMVGFMRAIPRGFEEAAMIDGCSNFRILTQIILPMAKPGTITVCMLSALAIWNDYPVALVMLTDEKVMTLPVSLARLNLRAGQYSDYGALFAALVIVLVPTIIMYSVGQRHLIQGVSAGGIKD